MGYVSPAALWVALLIGLDVCGVLLIANIIRIFFWLGERFEIRKLTLPWDCHEGAPAETAQPCYANRSCSSSRNSSCSPFVCITPRTCR